MLVKWAFNHCLLHNTAAAPFRRIKPQTWVCDKIPPSPWMATWVKDVSTLTNPIPDHKILDPEPNPTKLKSAVAPLPRSHICICKASITRELEQGKDAPLRERPVGSVSPSKGHVSAGRRWKMWFLGGFLEAEPGVSESSQCLLEERIPNEIQDENTCITSSERAPWEIEERDARQVDRIILNIFSLIKLKRRRAEERRNEKSIFSSLMVWQNLKFFINMLFSSSFLLPITSMSDHCLWIFTFHLVSFLNPQLSPLLHLFWNYYQGKKVWPVSNWEIVIMLSGVGSCC